MDNFKLLFLGLSVLCWKRGSYAQRFGIEQPNQMTEMVWTKQDFINSYPAIAIKDEPARFEIETDEEDKLAFAAMVMMAITTALIIAALVLVAAFFWYIRCQIKALVNVENNIHENRWRDFTASLNSFTVRSESNTDSIQSSLQSTSHQNILYDYTYVEIDNRELDYRSPGVDPDYDEVQDSSLQRTALDGLSTLDARSEGISDLNYLQID